MEFTEPCTAIPDATGVHHFVMPRFGGVMNRRRTVIHTTSEPESGDTVKVGDRLALLPSPNFPRAVAAHVVEVERMNLGDVLISDLPLLGLQGSTCEEQRQEYVISWDATFPETPVDSNPEVTRIVFAYGWPTKEGGA